MVMANQLYVNYTLIISYNINVYCLKSKKINKMKYCNTHANDPKKSHLEIRSSFRSSFI